MKKLLLIVFSFILVSFFSLLGNTPKTFAQYTPWSSSMMPATDPGVPQNLKTTLHGAFLNALSEVTCLLAGSDPFTLDHQCLGYDANTGLIGYTAKSGGALGMLIKAIVLTYDIPIHSASYANYLAQNFHGISDKSYAAANPNEVGAGAQGLDPLLAIWVGFRNTSYLLVVVIFVILGLLIMLRVKIDPRTVMTIQNQIPKIIIGLVMITFSFAIAGFLIDLMYVTTYICLNIVKTAVPSLNLDPTKFPSYSTPFDAVNSILPGTINIPTQGTVHAGIYTAVNTADGSLGAAINGVVAQVPVLGQIEGIFQAITFLIGAIGSIIGWALSGGQWNPPDFSSGGLVGIIVWIILIVAIFTALFRFWIQLIQTYLVILFTVILGPIRILFGLVPTGPGGGTSGWLKDLIANLAVFPVSITFIALAGAIAAAMNSSTAFTPFFVPGAGIGGILAFATILMLPKVPDQVKEWFKVKGGGLGDAIGASVAAGAAVAGAAGRQTGKRLFQRELPLQGQAEGWLRRIALGDPGQNKLRRRVVEKMLGEQRAH